MGPGMELTDAGTHSALTDFCDKAAAQAYEADGRRYHISMFPGIFSLPTLFSTTGRPRDVLIDLPASCTDSVPDRSSVA